MRKIRKGDEVIVIAGKDKGKKSTVTGFKSDQFVFVQNINKVKKHVKPNPHKNEIGGVSEIVKPIHVSNIAIYNFNTQKADRIGFKFNDAGNKCRFFKSNGDLIDNNK